MVKRIDSLPEASSLFGGGQGEDYGGGLLLSAFILLHFTTLREHFDKLNVKPQCSAQCKTSVFGSFPLWRGQGGGLRRDIHNPTFTLREHFDTLREHFDKLNVKPQRSVLRSFKKSMPKSPQQRKQA